MDQGLSQGAGTAPEAIEERRIHPRLVNPPVHVSGPRVSINDVSLGGIHLIGAGPAEVGERMELILTDAETHYTETLEAEVMWRRRDAAGMRWVNLTERQTQWLEQRMDCWTADPNRLLIQRLAVR